MIFKLGQVVEIIRPPLGYTGFTEDYIGAVGMITAFSMHTEGSEEDPEITVTFDDGSDAYFFEDELEPFISDIDEDYDTNSSIYNKQHRFEIARQTGGCTYCPPHCGENATRHKPKPDKYKNKR